MTCEAGCRFTSPPTMKGRLSVYLRSPGFNQPPGLGLLAEAHRRTPLVVCPVLGRGWLYGRVAESNGMDAPTRNGINVPKWKC